MDRMMKVIESAGEHDSPERFRKLGVDVFTDEARFEAPDLVAVDGRRLSARSAIIATGSHSATPPIEGLEEVGYLTHVGALELRRLPRSIVVVGSGPIGCEFAQIFARFGSEATLISSSPLPKEDPEIGEVLEQALLADGVTLHGAYKGESARVEVGEMPDYGRPDLAHVPDPSERPTGPEYDRYIWLVEVIKRVGCDDDAIYDTSPFLVKDVLASAILVRANEALLEISEVAGAPDEDRATIRDWIARGRQGLDERWDPGLELCLDYDLRAGEPLRARTIAGFAPLISGTERADRLRTLLEVLGSRAFVGHPDLRWPLPSSTSPEEPEFHPRSYWRGPVWPVMNWLLWWSLVKSGERERATRLKDHGLAQLSDGRFGEYYEPFTGEPLGSDEQSWTAAVALDWLADEEEVSEKP
jgi:hypothetical protein